MPERACTILKFPKARRVRRADRLPDGTAWPPLRGAQTWSGFVPLGANLNIGRWIKPPNPRDRRNPVVGKIVRVGPFRPRAGRNRRLLVGEDQSRRPAEVAFRLIVV
jgi:hypothetical protein